MGSSQSVNGAPMGSSLEALLALPTVNMEKHREILDSLLVAERSFAEVQDTLSFSCIRGLRDEHSQVLLALLVHITDRLEAIVEQGSFSGNLTPQSINVAFTSLYMLMCIMPVVLEQPGSSNPLLGGASISDGLAPRGKNARGDAEPHSSAMNLHSTYPHPSSSGVQGDLNEPLATTPGLSKGQPAGYSLNDQPSDARNVSFPTIGVEPLMIPVQQMFWKSYVVRSGEIMFQAESPKADGLAGPEEADNADKLRHRKVLGIQILSVLQRLLFLNGFSVTAAGVLLSREEALPKHKVDSRFIWKGGIGGIMHSASPPSPLNIRARIAVLRCLLMCFSYALYESPDEQHQEFPPVWLWVFTRGYLPYTANLYCSLINTIVAFEPTKSYFSFRSTGDMAELVATSLQVLCILVDFQAPGAANGGGDDAALSTPSGSALLHSSSSRDMGEHPTGIAATVEPEMLAVSPNKQPVPEPSSQSSAAASAIPAAPPNKAAAATVIPGGTSRAPLRSQGSAVASHRGKNVYRLMLSNMKKDAEIDFIFEGINRFLQFVTRHRKAQGDFFDPVDCHQELIIFFWQFVACNPHIARRVAANPVVLDFFSAILRILVNSAMARRVQLEAFLTEMRTGNPATGSTSTAAKSGGAPSMSSYQLVGQEKMSLLHSCSFVLLVLSSQRDFAVGLNAPYSDRNVPSIPFFSGNYADLLVLTIHRVVLDSLTGSANDSLIDLLLTVLCNVSAYVKSFCLESSVKLMALLARFSKPSWLFRAPYQYHNVFFLLDTLNNAIQYQYEGNLNLVYSTLRQRDLFLDLQSLSFPEPLHENGVNSNQFHGETSWPSSQAASGADPSSKPMPTAITHSERRGPDGAVLLQNDGGAEEKGTVGFRRTETSEAESGGDEKPWTPTREWFEEWKSKIPLHTILRLISCLLPMVETECQEKGLINQEEVLEYLRKTTLVGLLPVPHAIIIRNYHPNAYTAMWFTTYLWGVIVSRIQHLRLVDPRSIKFLLVNSIDDY